MTDPKPRISDHDYRVDPDDPIRVVMRRGNQNVWRDLGPLGQSHGNSEVAHWTRLMPVPEYRPEFRARRYDRPVSESTAEGTYHYQPAANPQFRVTNDGMFLCSDHDRGLKPGWACPNCRDLNGNPAGTSDVPAIGPDRAAEVSMHSRPSVTSYTPVSGRYVQSEAAAKTPQGATNRRTLPDNALVSNALNGKSLLCQMTVHSACITAASECNCECHDRTAENET